jgi:hypothetical protein
MVPALFWVAPSGLQLICQASKPRPVGLGFVRSALRAFYNNNVLAQSAMSATLSGVVSRAFVEFAGDDDISSDVVATRG